MSADEWWQSPPAERRDSLRRLEASELAALYQRALAVGAPRPPDAAAEPAPWSGKNPLPAWLPALSCFEKRFFVADGAVFGYNHTRYQALAGPGYFGLVAAEEVASRYAVTAPERQWALDYRRLPARAPAGAPAVSSSDAARLKVFAGLCDFVLPLGDHLLVGAAFAPHRPEQPVAHFAIVRP